MKLKFNSYNVLWLETNASHKEINKRYKEIEKYLNIGEIPSYESDLSFLDYKQIRTSNSIKSAFESLSNDKHKFYEFFFWFQINDSTDEQAMASLKQWNHKEAIQIWKEQYESNNTNRRFLYAKNLLTLLLLKWVEGDTFISKNIEETTNIWKEMIDTSTFWKLFESIFDEANDETDDFKITKTQKDEIIKNLSSIYMNIGESISDLSIFWKFSQLFNLATSSVDHSMMDVIYQSIEWAVKDLEELDISSDWIFDAEEKKIVKDSINLIQEALNKTIDLSFYEDSRILLYRDRASKAIRKIVLDLHNNLDETKKSLALLKIAQQISWTENLKEQINIDINQIQKNLDFNKNEEFIAGIMNDFENGNADSAIQKIDIKCKEHWLSEELKKVLLDLKVAHYDRLRIHWTSIKKAPSLETIYTIWVTIYGDTRYFVILMIPIFPIDRWSLKDNWWWSYQFYWKLELTKKQTIWRNVVLLAIVIWIVVAMINV